MEEIGLEAIGLHILKLMKERNEELKKAGEELRLSQEQEGEDDQP